ncbi:glycosyltransferase [Gluconobacter sp. OJB]|uniref:glycosyltransferase family 4 protein n=1 Tax=Gluconobacter sp. OJB TaxID=3145196 RepID=UPI0031F76E4E
MKVFVQLAYGFGGKTWRERWKAGRILGLNEEQAYGYSRVASDDVKIVYSEDQHENPFQKLLRYSVRAVFGFDFVHAWRNRKKMLAADVVWTHTESQTLSVLLLFRILKPVHRPKILGQVVWLMDRWRKQPFWRRWFFRFLMQHLDLLTVHSVCNLEDGQRLFPNLWIEQVRFGIRADDMKPARKTCQGKKLKVLSLGNDEHRDWKTFCAAAKALPDVEFSIASSARAAFEASKNISNVTLVRAKDNVELIGLYSEADIVVVPLQSNRHASGITVVEEAIILGVPVISSDCGGLTDYFDSDSVLYVPTKNPKALAEAISAVRADPSGALQRTETAQERVKNTINSVQYARKHVELSKELLDA